MNAVDQAYAEALSESEIKLTRQIIAARKYHFGQQNVQLTDRLKQFIGEQFGGFEFRLNIVRTVIQTITEKLAVIGFDADNNDTTNTEAILWAANLWEKNNLDARQTDIFESALRDGAHYVIVDWPEDKGYPRWLPQQQYTSTEAGGDGNGCTIKYPQGDPNLDPLVGIKYWTEMIDGQNVQRRTMYFPDRIEKWARTGGGGDWSQFRDEGDTAWPIPWVDVEGQPLGVAVVPFYNKNLMPEAADAIPLQDAANKVVVDLLSTEDQTAYRVLVALGFIPTSDGMDLKSDGSNALEIQPGIVIGTTKSKREANVSAIEPANLGPITDLVQQLVLWIALVTDTPVSRFITTKLIASDETLKQQEEPLIAKVENRQKLFGNAIKECLRLSMKLTRLFGTDGEFTFTEDVAVHPIWKSAQSLVERLEELTLKKNLGVPLPQLWTELGYSQDKVKDWVTEVKAAELTPIEERTAPAAATVSAQNISTNKGDVENATTGD